ncbi:PREDICTED: SH3 and multiple ankyrin repeat domains protein 1-like, partial [Pseudopodoces humilis]|uniref:SH3 and multiple ankyrin repeat domains protein 1-like n=1 Tax=Pseudopodoces humilis TaxID=181119 RepID=UPI0006B72D06
TTEKKRTVYQMALNKLDEILAAAQQSISAGEGPGAPLGPPLGKGGRPKGFFGAEGPFEAHRMGPGGFERPFLPTGPPHGLMLRQKSIGAPEEDKPYLAPPAGKFSRSLSVPGSDEIPPPPTTSPPEPPYTPLPPPLEFANSFETPPHPGEGPPPPPPPPPGDSAASSLTSYDSEVATLTQSGPGGAAHDPRPRGGGGGVGGGVSGVLSGGAGPPPPEGPEVVTDSGIEEVDSRSSSDHPPEAAEGPPQDGPERRPRGRGALRGRPEWEETPPPHPHPRGGMGTGWSRAGHDGGGGGGFGGRHR